MDVVSDTEGYDALHFESVSRPLSVVVNGSDVTVTHEDHSVTTVTTNTEKIVLGSGDDEVSVLDYPDYTYTIEDTGGNDTYDLALSESPETLTPADVAALNRRVQITDNSGSFDEIIVQYDYSTNPVHLNHYQITNGSERIDFTGIERETIVNGAVFSGRHAHDSDVAIEYFGDPVAFTTTDPSGISDLGSTGLRVIASDIDMQSNVRAGHIMMDSFQTLEITQRLTAIGDGYIDLRTYGDEADLLIGAEISVSSGAAEDGQGEGWMRLTAPGGSILNTNE